MVKKWKTLKPLYKGVILIICSAFFFALMNMFVRLSGDLPSVQKSFFRNLIAFFFAGAVLIKDKEKITLQKDAIVPLLLRSVFGTVGILCNFYAIDQLALADASILNKMSPFFAIIFSIFLLKEKLKLTQALIVFGAFIGALCVIKPDLANAQTIPALIGLCGGMCAGMAYCVLFLWFFLCGYPAVFNFWLYTYGNTAVNCFTTCRLVCCWGTIYNNLCILLCTS